MGRARESPAPGSRRWRHRIKRLSRRMRGEARVVFVVCAPANKSRGAGHLTARFDSAAGHEGESHESQTGGWRCCVPGE
jgi:hypothetical protein